MGDDLSEYERRRLENIQRNNAFLASLGFEAPIEASQRSRDGSEDKSRVKGKRQRTKEVVSDDIPRRRSPRLQGIPQVTKQIELEIDETKEDELDYSTIAYGYCNCDS